MVWIVFDILWGHLKFLDCTYISVLLHNTVHELLQAACEAFRQYRCGSVKVGDTGTK